MQAALNKIEPTQLVPNKIVTGVVSKIEKYGAFVKINGTNFTGLVHISEISKDYVKDVDEYLKNGDEVKVRVVTCENGKISLSIRKADESFEKDDLLKDDLLKEIRIKSSVNYGYNSDNEENNVINGINNKSEDKMENKVENKVKNKKSNVLHKKDGRTSNSKNNFNPKNNFHPKNNSKPLTFEQMFSKYKLDSEDRIKSIKIRSQRKTGNTSNGGYNGNSW